MFLFDIMTAMELLKSSIGSFNHVFVSIYTTYDGVIFETAENIKYKVFSSGKIIKYNSHSWRNPGTEEVIRKES